MSSDEIADIMQEINSLQKGMAEAPAMDVSTESEPASHLSVVPDELAETAPEPEETPEEVATAEEGDLSDFRGSSAEPAMDDTLADIKEDTQSKSLLDGVVQAPARPMEDKMEQNEGTLAMTLTGSMSLKLKYEFEGNEVTICFVDQCLKVEMSDGTEFKIPVGAAKKAA